MGEGLVQHQVDLSIEVLDGVLRGRIGPIDADDIPFFRKPKEATASAGFGEDDE